jgi:hypothetical protein
MTRGGHIVATCRRDGIRQRIGILDLPLVTPRPAGTEWSAAYRLSNDREGNCAMGFVPIRMDEFIKLHRKSNPGERLDEFIILLRRSVADARQGARCYCGAPIWAIGSPWWETLVSPA